MLFFPSTAKPRAGVPMERKLLPRVLGPAPGRSSLRRAPGGGEGAGRGSGLHRTAQDRGIWPLRPLTPCCPALLAALWGSGGPAGKPDNHQWESGPAAGEDRGSRFIPSSEGGRVSRRPRGSLAGPWGDWPPRGPMSLGFRSRGGSGDTSPSHGPPHSLVCCDAGEGRGSGDEGAGEAGWEEECSSLRPSFASLSQSEPHDAACPSHELGKRSGRLGASERPVNRCLRRIRRRA